MLIKLLYVNLLFFSLTGRSQLLQSERFELPIDTEEAGFEITPVKNHGVVLSRMIFSSEGNHLQIIHADTVFQSKWNGFMPIDRNFTLANLTASDDYLFFLFIKQNLADRNFHLYQVDLKSGDYTKFVVRNSIPFMPTFLETNGKGVLMGGYFIKVPIVLYYSLTLQQAKILPGLLNEAGELNQVHVNPDKTFDLLISSKNYQNQKTIWIKNYDSEGGLIRNTILDPEENSNFIFAQTIRTDNSQLIAGVYGRSRNTEYSKGLFVATVNPFTEQHTQYYRFTELENFFKYLQVKKENRIKAKIERKKIKGKKIRFQYRFLVHELVPYKDYYILLGEAFYPKYKRSDQFGGALVAGDMQIFDGYQYTHAVIIGVSKDGKLLWDNSFEINDVKTFTLEQFVKMDLQKDAVNLLYLYDNKIRTKIIKDSTVVEGKTYSPVQMKFVDDMGALEFSRINKLEYWYDDYFLISGTEERASLGTKRRKKRTVFYIKKIKYH